MAELINIVTGYKDEPHVTSADDGSLNAGIFGEGTYILNRGQKMRAEIVNANTVRIYDGDVVIQGRQGRIETGNYKELTIDNGAQGMNRNDLVVVRYTKDASTQVESMELDVIKGTATSGTPLDPSYTNGNIFSGAILAEYPLYRITVNGLTPASPVKIANIVNSLSSGFAVENPDFTWRATNAGPSSTGLIRYIASLGLCFDKSYLSVNRLLNSGYAYLIGTVESGYRPSYRQPLSAVTATGDNVPIYIQDNGEIYIKPTSDLSTGTSVYINGFWFV